MDANRLVHCLYSKASSQSVEITVSDRSGRSRHTYSLKRNFLALSVRKANSAIAVSGAFK